jgi:hypothetical protein
MLCSFQIPGQRLMRWLSQVFFVSRRPPAVAKPKCDSAHLPGGHALVPLLPQLVLERQTEKLPVLSSTPFLNLLPLSCPAHSLPTFYCRSVQEALSRPTPCCRPIQHTPPNLPLPFYPAHPRIAKQTPAAWMLRAGTGGRRLFSSSCSVSLCLVTDRVGASGCKGDMCSSFLSRLL